MSDIRVLVLLLFVCIFQGPDLHQIPVCVCVCVYVCVCVCVCFKIEENTHCSTFTTSAEVRPGFWGGGGKGWTTTPPPPPFPHDKKGSKKKNMYLRGNISSNLSLSKKKKRKKRQKKRQREKKKKKKKKKKSYQLAFKLAFGLTFGECTKKCWGHFFPLVNSCFFLKINDIIPSFHQVWYVGSCVINNFGYMMLFSDKINNE